MLSKGCLECQSAPVGLLLQHCTKVKMPRFTSLKFTENNYIHTHPSSNSTSRQLTTMKIRHRLLQCMHCIGCIELMNKSAMLLETTDV